MKMNTKILIFFIFICFIFACTTNKDSSNLQQNFEWQISSFEEQKLNQKNIDSLIQRINDNVYGNIDELLIIKNDTVLIHENYNRDYAKISKGQKGKMGCGIDACLDSADIHIYNYYHPKFHPYYQKENIHTLQSITKSVTSTIIGCAIKEGKIKSVDEKIFPVLKDYSINDESIKTHYQNVNLYDVLSMQLGIEWKELGLSLEQENNVSAMEKSNDWIEYVLEQKVDTVPGTKWIYNSGATQLLSLITKKKTSKNIDDYANEVLFKKLDIQNYYWKKTPTGLADTEGGLYLNAKDLAKIGRLYLQNGVWNNEQILPENWVEIATKKQVIDIYGDGGKEGYGYQWWLTKDEQPKVIGLGYGNQFLIILPKENIIGVVFAWNVFEEKSKYIYGDFMEVLENIK